MGFWLATPACSICKFMYAMGTFVTQRMLFGFCKVGCFFKVISRLTLCDITSVLAKLDAIPEKEV